MLYLYSVKTAHVDLSSVCMCVYCFPYLGSFVSVFVIKLMQLEMEQSNSCHYTVNFIWHTKIHLQDSQISMNNTSLFQWLCTLKECSDIKSLCQKLSLRFKTSRLFLSDFCTNALIVASKIPIVALALLPLWFCPYDLVSIPFRCVQWGACGLFF